MYSSERMRDIRAVEGFITGGMLYDPCHENPPAHVYERMREQDMREDPNEKVIAVLHICSKTGNVTLERVIDSARTD